MKLFIGLCCILAASLAFATASSPVPVSSVTVSAGVATVTTSSAHNIPSNNPGFCLQGSSVSQDVLCGTAASVPSSTTFTFNTSTALNCSSSCGTAQPAKNFLVFGNPLTGQIGIQQVNVCFWNYVTTPLPNTGRTTACAAAETNTNLLTSENAALASGSWTETFLSFTFSTSDTRGQIEQEFQRIQFAMQLAIAAGIQPGRDQGTFCDAVGCNQ